MPHSKSGLVELSPVVSFDLFDAKLRAPAVRPGSVPRTPLINRLRASRSRSVVTVLAPAGYGKTTVIGQWAGRDQRPFAWLSIDEEDNDPATFSKYVALALSRVSPVDPAVFDALETPVRSTAHFLRRLASALLSAPRPLALVLDNVHLLRSRECIDVVAALAEHFPEQSTLVVAGRDLPRLPIARARATGRLFEVGVEELALSRRETILLLRSLDLELEAAEMSELTDRTEGWAAGVYLAALSLKDGRTNCHEPHGARGDDRFVADYFGFEHLSLLEPRDVDFLTRTSMLERMCGSLCDAVLGSTGSAGRLDSLAKANLFLVPLDRRREWYRYHHQFRDCLRAELERREPDVVVELNRRAAAWCEANGAPEEAVSHAHAAGDFDCLARLVGKLALPMCATGRTAIVEEWLGWFDDERLERYPAVAVLGAWVHLLRGRGAAAKQWLSVGERSNFDSDLHDGSRSLEPWIAVVRAAICRDGAERMRTDAELAVRDLGAASGWRPAANLLLGVAQVLLGEDEQGDESLADAAEAAESAGATTTRIVALAERSLLSAARGNDAGAEALAVQARALIDEGQVGDDLLSAIAFAACVRQGLRRGNLVEARADLRQADALTPQLTHSIPWYSVQTHLELGRAELALLNTPGARARLSAAAEILSRRPQLGALNAQSDALHAEAAKFAGVCKDRSTTLTKAELRLLPFLTTHLSMPEIAEHLFVSRNTVKSQAITLYRKLDASSRSAAIAKAIELGLIDAPTPPRPTRLAVPG